MDAQGALDSLLGRLTSILVDEAQLLGRVRGDVEFIKGEMECMNSLILQLTEAHHRDYLVRAWMKQELKARACDVGDRRQRYGVTVPPTSPTAAADIYDGDVKRASDEEDLRRRAVLFDDAEPPEDYEEAVQKYIDTLVKCLSREPPPAAAAKDSDEPQVRVFSITRSDYWDCSLYESYMASPVARGAYEHPSVSTLFDCKALVNVFSHKEKDIARTVLAKILGEITGVQQGREDEQSTEKSLVDKDEEELSSELQGHLKGKRFLFVIIDKRGSKEQWKRILDALLHAADRCHPGSAIIVTTKSPSPYKIINAISLEEFYQEKIFELGQRYKDDVHRDMCTKIRNATLYSSAFARKMFMHLVYVNPIMKEDELRNYYHAISMCQQLSDSGIPQKMKLLKVLDLEGCHGLEKHHLKSICKILLLKYLSLRNTDVAELPKQIKELQCLETLDIRQTKKVSASNDARSSEESIVTVSMPLGIQKMINMEILSHVQITDRDSELAGIAQLLKLRKLGVALQGKNVKLSDLFCQIEKLHKCLRSLSIRMGSPAGSENHHAEAVDSLPSLPEFIERLNICGITSGLVCSIKEHHRLAKITLSDTYLTEDGLRILGNLAALRGLKLLHKSYTESELYFKKCEFQSLAYLLVEGKDITTIRFAIGAAPKLQRILWTFETMDVLSGIDWLPRLKKLELNGDCDLDPIKEALESHPTSCATLEHKPHQQRQA
ncbi:unnamed protein product [Urochloa decumbens]|uniref:Rx N-terminal domain-containing protein n=1 Tax=Urochloa decumbens TaxID=240449 RepID=A0ABC9ASM8_9POAL